MSIPRPSRRCLSRAPAWAVATARRLDFHARPRRPGTAGLRRGVPALRDWLNACLDQVEAVAAEVAPLCALARAAIDGDGDDRAVNAAAAGMAGFAAQVPGRAVWLAAVAAGLPEEEGAAAARLADDLAAVGVELPLRAWAAALAAGSREI